MTRVCSFYLPSRNGNTARDAQAHRGLYRIDGQPLLVSADTGTLVDAVELGLHDVVLVRFDQRLDPGLVLRFFAHGDEVAVRVVGDRLLGNAVFRSQAALQ